MKLPGRATHLEVGRSTACGLAGTVFKTSDLNRVDCRRCRRTKFARKRTP